MAFAVDQGCNQSIIGSCLLSEHDPSKRSFRASSWIPEDENEARVQGFFAAASERLVKYHDPSLKLSEPTFIPHAMACEQMQLTTDVAPCTPLPSLPRHAAQRHEVTDPTPSLPSLCLSIGSPGPYPISRNEKSSVNDQSYASKHFSYPLAVQSSCPLSPTLPKSLNAHQINSQSPQSDVYDKNLPSLLRPNQPVNSQKGHYNQLSLGSSRPNQPMNSHEAHDNQLALGPSCGEVVNQKNSCTSRFSFIEALTSECTDEVQLGQQENVLRHNILLEHDGRTPICCSPSNGRSESIQFLSEKTSKIFDLQHDDSIETFKGSLCSSHRRTNCIISSQASKIVVLDQSRESSSLLHSTQPKEATLSLSQVFPTRIPEPSVIKTKQDWNASKSIECVQMLPDFFAQQKVNVKQLDILSENNFNDRGNPEKRCKLLFSEENTGASSCGEYSPKLLANTEYMARHQGDQHSCGLGSLDANMKWKDERLATLNISKVNSEAKQGTMENRIIIENSCSDVATLNSPPGPYPGNSVLSENTIPMDEMKSIELSKELTSGVNGLQGFPRQQELEKTVAEWGESTPVSVVKGSLVVDGDWGKFLALSATPVPIAQSTAEIEVLPFQQRFKQLQMFLKQCDESDQTYCLEALRLLSAAERSGRAVALETRAVNLSMEEGKELKRMKMLNVLSKYSDSSITPQGPKLPAPGTTILHVKQES